MSILHTLRKQKFMRLLMGVLLLAVGIFSVVVGGIRANAHCSTFYPIVLIVCGAAFMGLAVLNTCFMTLQRSKKKKWYCIAIVLLFVLLGVLVWVSAVRLFNHNSYCDSTYCWNSGMPPVLTACFNTYAKKSVSDVNCSQTFYPPSRALYGSSSPKDILLVEVCCQEKVCPPGAVQCFISCVQDAQQYYTTISSKTVDGESITIGVCCLLTAFGVAVTAGRFLSSKVTYVQQKYDVDEAHSEDVHNLYAPRGDGDEADSEQGSKPLKKGRKKSQKPLMED